jgi:anion-transporting  ArsA/GET3 family ATPase
MNRLDLRAARLVVCMGPGGVGKTTLSAALAVTAAAAGRKVAVMTVDPAPRLLDALGLAAGDAGPHEVALPRAPRGGHPAPHHGRLRAYRLDPKHTFDAIVERNAPSPGARDAILKNRIYRNLSGALSGVGDYMAMEKLVELSADPATELLVLDTPPAAEALDFLDAPRRLLDLLGSRAVTLLGSSASRLGARLRVVDLAARAVLAAFDRVTRLHLLGDVQSFVAGFEGMYEGFRERARRADALLREDTTAIVIVTTAEAERIAQAREFIEALAHKGLRVSAVVINRAMGKLPAAAELERARIPAALRHKLKLNLADYSALKRREADSVESLRAPAAPGAAMLLAPELGRQPRRIADLAALGRELELL